MHKIRRYFSDTVSMQTEPFEIIVNNFPASLEASCATPTRYGRDRFHPVLLAGGYLLFSDLGDDQNGLVI